MLNEKMGEIKLKKVWVMNRLFLIIAMYLYGPLLTLPNQSDSNFMAGTTINIPKGKCRQIVVDGKFHDDEWIDAIQFAQADYYNILFKADDELLAVGLKFPKPMGELVCEIRITADDKEVFLLHSSGGMGEGVSGFPATTKFDLKNIKLWESSFSTKNPEKEAEWIAAGEPIERYDEVYNKRDGIEFKISQQKIASDSLKFTIGWIRVEIKDGKPDFKRYNYPAEASLQNSGNWVKLILPGAISSYVRPVDFPKLSGPYMGQKEPGAIPKKFNPGIVRADYRFYANFTFNPGFTEVCWTPNFKYPNCLQGGLIISKLENDVWSNPTEICFLDTIYNHQSPFYDYNGKRLYFQGHLKSNQGWDQMEKFYYVEIIPNGYSKPILLDTIFNKYAIHWQFSTDHENNLYFGGDLRGFENSGGIYYSKWHNGKYLVPKLIFRNQDYPDAVFGPAIAPKGDYLLFTRIHPRGSKNPRIFSIYIAFRKSENDWTEPVELGEKLKMDGNQPRISPDDKYLFFIGNDGSCYWVSTKIIDELRPK